jgi:glycosyltransferase involved in cell wall biosynthesis
MIIGVLNYRFDYYPYLRTIINRVPGVEYQKVQDLYSNLRRAALKANRTLNKDIFATFDLNNQFQDFNLNKVDLLHFFNGISYGKTPWVSSFETLVPRLSSIVTRHQGQTIQTTAMNARIQRAFDMLSSDSCKQIIALSECSKNMQIDLLQEFPSVDSGSIIEKMTVLHPPQAALIADYSEKNVNLDEKIKFIFVGAAFFRKGGRELLTTFKKMVRTHHYPIELILISSLRLDHYAAHETESDLAWAKQEIEANKDWITYYEQLSNPQVLELMKTSHIGLLPTYADTYGYSTLEFQAAGLPVITSDIRALPEINTNETGWLINVPRNRLGEALYETPAEREALSEAICEGLETVLHEIFADLSRIAQKGKNSLARLKLEHDPEQYGESLREIYQQALKSA